MRFKKVKGLTKVNGCWQIRHWHEGKLLYKRFPDGLPQTYEIAVRMIKDFDRQVDAGEYYEERRTLEEVYDYLDKEKRDKGRKKEQSSIITKGLFKNHIAKYLKKDKYIDEFTETEILDFQDKILNSELKPSTQSKVIFLLKQIYKTARRYHWIKVGGDHSQLLECPRVTKEKIKVFTEEQQERLYVQARTTFKNNQNYLGMLILGLHGGLRLGEMRGVRWQDIDFENHMLHVTEQYNSTLDRRTDLKTEGSKRELEILPVEAELKNMYEKARKQAGFDKSDCVLTGYSKGYTGRPLSINCLREMLGRITVASGLSEEKGLHILRKTCATTMQKRGYTMQEVCAWLGHSKEKITWSVYTDKDVIRASVSEKMRKEYKQKGA